jgi:nucleoside-diphosphate-sugar epimerase
MQDSTTTTMPANRVLMLLLLSTLGFSPPCLALAMDSSGSGRRVLVTGAGGQTGQHVFRKLLARPGYIPIGTVRSEASKKALIESGNVPPENVVVCDITQGGPKLDELIKDCDAVMICTSAKPAPTGEADEETKRPKFGFPNGEPEIVDWGGQKNLIDAATATNKCHVIICSSMGGTNPNHMLNSLGKTMNADGTSSGGDILKWKRKAEVYLIESGLPYTIVHPGGLLNEPGNERELCLGVDDTVQGTSNNSIPREDVANVMIAALENDEYRGRSFDLVSKPVGDGIVTTDYVKLVESLEGKNCDYKLGVIA